MAVPTCRELLERTYAYAPRTKWNITQKLFLSLKGEGDFDLCVHNGAGRGRRFEVLLNMHSAGIVEQLSQKIPTKPKEQKILSKNERRKPETDLEQLHAAVLALQAYNYLSVTI